MVPHVTLMLVQSVFVFAPELAHLAGESKDMAGVSRKVQDQHYNLAALVTSPEEKNIYKLSSTVSCYTNHFTQSGDELLVLSPKLWSLMM